jgi:signal transduction histidine kinase
MGMGLSIVWRVVQAHGGTVTVGASASGGALFTLRLPHTPVA